MSLDKPDFGMGKTGYSHVKCIGSTKRSSFHFLARWQKFEKDLNKEYKNIVKVSTLSDLTQRHLQTEVDQSIQMNKQKITSQVNKRQQIYFSAIT